MDSITKSFVLKNELGLHARPASMLVKKLKDFESEVKVETDTETVNGKSILELMMLAATPGTTLTFTIRGSDAKPAMDAVEELFKSNFHGL